MNTEDKAAWCREGVRRELLFCDMMDGARMNPAKDDDPYAPDLIVNGRLADLKCQWTPFFTAAKYGIDPTDAVTFNRKDVLRYLDKYPQLDVFFWMKWEAQHGYGTFVEARSEVRRAEFRDIVLWVEMGAPLHSYTRRKDDILGNARDSYILDVNRMERVL